MGIEEAEGQGFEFGFDLVETEPAGQRGEEELRLGGDFPLLLRPHRLKRAHIVEPVGEFEDEDADIAFDGFEDVLEVVDLGFVGLGDGPDEEGDVRSEPLSDLFDRMVRVFDDVVQQGGGDDRGVPLTHLPRDDERHGKRVQDIGLPALAGLARMRLLRQPVGILHQRPFLRCKSFRQRVHQLVVRRGNHLTVIHSYIICLLKQ